MLRVKPNSSVVFCFIASSGGKGRFNQPPRGLRDDFSVLENSLPAKNGPNNFACQLAPSVRALLMAIKKILALDLERLLEIDEGQVGIRAGADSTLCGRKTEHRGDVGRE